MVLVGLPGSGKSTLAAHIAAHVPGAVRVSQDECGRSRFSALVSQSAPLLVIDRCNLTRAHRSDFGNDAECWAVILATSIEDATLRVQQRPEHPTLGPARAAEVIAAMAATYEPVDEAERFGRVIVLGSDNAVDEFLATTLGIPALQLESAEPQPVSMLFKFPRTQHLADLGSATRDDLVLDAGDLADFLGKRVAIEEKVDGANLGISIDPATYEVKFQNRSHFVNSSTATQFKKLGHWLSLHREALFDLLEPGRHVLFGEWLHARHTIPYSSLPGYFIAFDMLDTVDGTFWSRRRLEAALRDTNIPCVRLISEEVPGTLDRLVTLATTAVSTYYPGLVEGIVARICDDILDCTVKRGKIVRPNFLVHSTEAPAKHWTSREMEENKLAF